MIFAYAAVPITMFFFFGSLMPDVAFGATKLRRLGSSQVRASDSVRQTPLT